MRDNVYKFRKIKWGEPERLEMISGLKPKQRRSHYSSGLIILCAFIGLVAFQAWPKLFAAFSPTPTERVSAPAAISLRVIDGDTVNPGDGRPNVRLVGFNAPETGERARCEAEHKRGEAAKDRLRDLVASGRSDLQHVACSCTPGTEGTNACNFGRRCGTLRINGVDAGETLIREGLAVPFVCGATSCPALPRPWC
jgi:endonuclease YncB( thermonuclease family)